jgi:hypothetical protein
VVNIGIVLSNESIDDNISLSTTSSSVAGSVNSVVDNILVAVVSVVSSSSFVNF